MSRRSILWLGPVGLLLAIGTLAGACGSSGGSLSLEDYFQKVDALDEESSNKTSGLDDELQATDDVDEARDLITELIAAFDEFRDSLADLDAPDEAADAQASTIEGFDAFIAELTGALESASDATTIDELYGAFLNVDESGVNQATEACIELEQIANDNGIDVDFDCGEGGDEPTATPQDGESGSLEEYYSALDSAENEYRAGSDSVGEQLDALDDSTASQAASLMAEGKAGIDDFVAALEDLAPPEEVAEAHAETVAGFQAASAWIGDHLDEFESATSVAEITALFSSPEFTDISNSLDGTCDALQAIADENGVIVDLSCGG